jgi:hypothetical protein
VSLDSGTHPEDAPTQAVSASTWRIVAAILGFGRSGV